MKTSIRIFLLIGGLSFVLIACGASQPTSESDPLTNMSTATPEYVGCANATYPDWETSIYVLPFSTGETYRTRLTNCSTSYHAQGKDDQFAYDFAMPIGTLITASRAGKVIFVEQDGKGRELNNSVTVDHGDNTYAGYLHLKQNGSLVEVGDVVEQGDSIGLSGVTGAAGYPHLHFIVTKDGWDWPYTGTPVTFRNTAPNPRGLITNGEYTALPH